MSDGQHDRRYRVLNSFPRNVMHEELEKIEKLLIESNGLSLEKYCSRLLIFFRRVYQLIEQYSS